ncbi:MAG TPA: hypothetical protein VHL34_08760 [Rhizomicrobium sp.]|jgi:hypothetical protein|nr:hypothetical protein [Rhizomicrobium sp.]
MNLRHLALISAVALMAATEAGAAQMVVAEARGIGLKPGAMIDTSKPLTLKEGQHVTLISSSGATLKLDGPYNAAPDSDRGGTNIGSKLAALTTQNNVRLGEVGTTRTGEAKDKLPSPWLLNVSHPGAVCLREGTSPVLWRNAAKAATPATIMPADRSWKLQLDWPAGSDTLAVTDDVSVHSGATYFVSMGGPETAIKINAVPALLETDSMRAAWMADRGCTEQAEAVLRASR